MKSVWNGKNRTMFPHCLAVILLAFFSGCNDAPKRPGEGFYSYQGFRDWWRIPLRFPYQVGIIDSFDRGLLEKYDPNSRIDDPKCDTIADNITGIGYHDDFTVFRRDNKEKPYGILIYASGETSLFSTETELEMFVKQKFPDTAVPKMTRLDMFYEGRWKTINEIRKTAPEKLKYGY